mmetsp:Transcript_27123/g.56364  ORF Transcript_27123/g.56364 Transcript_27123/m.56364 type:complete len:293 (-) Transcript_27123:360-1238(-)
MPPSVSRAMVEPTVLQIPMHSTPWDLAWRRAARVSAVSPDCEMTMTMSSSGRSTTLRYRNSEAYSTSTGTLQRASRTYSPTRPACHDVPQPQMMMRRAARRRSSMLNWAPSGPMSCSIPPSVTCRSPPAPSLPSTAVVTRPRMQLRRAEGCSMISLSMKCLYPPFSICSRVPSSATSAGFSGAPLSVDTWWPEARRTTTISPSLRWTTLRVYSRKADASLATNHSPSPTPRISGDPMRAAMRRSGSSCEQTQMPYAPTTWLRAWRVASWRDSPPDFLTSSMSFTSTSVSVSE